jgi:hypothetical protein
MIYEADYAEQALLGYGCAHPTVRMYAVNDTGV